MRICPKGKVAWAHFEEAAEPQDGNQENPPEAENQRPGKSFQQPEKTFRGEMQVEKRLRQKQTSRKQTDSPLAEPRGRRTASEGQTQDKAFPKVKGAKDVARQKGRIKAIARGLGPRHVQKGVPQAEGASSQREAWYCREVMRRDDTGEGGCSALSNHSCEVLTRLQRARKCNVWCQSRKRRRERRQVTVICLFCPESGKNTDL